MSYQPDRLGACRLATVIGRREFADATQRLLAAAQGGTWPLGAGVGLAYLATASLPLTGNGGGTEALDINVLYKQIKTILGSSTERPLCIVAPIPHHLLCERSIKLSLS